MSSQLALSEGVGAYGYGLYQSEIDEYLASDDEWEAIKASIFPLENIRVLFLSIGGRENIVNNYYKLNHTLSHLP